MIRPSSLPMLAACPCFESGPTEWTEGGTNRHRYLHLLWLSENCGANDEIEYANEKKMLAEKMDDEEIEACVWAYEYVKMTAALNDHPIYFERKMSCTLPDFSEMSGTPDVTCGVDLFDLKWRERDYHPQMAAYALMMFEAAENAGKPLPYVRVHVMFGAFKKIGTVYSLTQAQAELVVVSTIESASEKIIHLDGDGNLGSEMPKPTACEYCGWCKKNLICPAIVGKVKEVAIGYGDARPPEITSWHPSEMTTPEQVNFALSIKRNILQKWCDSIEYWADKWSVERGWIYKDFERVPTKGKKIIMDVAGAMALAKFSQEEILACCQVRLNTSKDYPDRKGMQEIFKSKGDYTSKKAAEKALLAVLEPVIQTGKDGWKLKSVKQTEDESE